jgi:hypothetical protein
MKFYNKYWRIAHSLQTEQLQRQASDSLSFSEQDLFSTDPGHRGGSLLLGYYSEAGIKLALEKYGIYAKLSHLGLSSPITVMDTSDPYKHRLAIYDGKRIPERLVSEVVLRKQQIKINMPYHTRLNGRAFNGLAIDWMCMQNPYKTFNENRPRLPGQRFPGLGMSAVVVELLMIISWRLKLAGLINIPEHYHNALFYSKIFYYLDPDIQAKFLAIKKQFRDYSLFKISWGIDWGCVIDLNLQKPFEWITSNQLVPLDKELKNHFYGKRYREYVREKKREFRFSFDEELYQKCKLRYSNQKMERII